VTAEFRPENPLEDALLYAFKTHDETMLLAELATGDLYLPADEMPEQEMELVAQPGDEFPLTTVSAPDGTEYVAAFSSLAQLAYVRPEGGGYRRIRGRTLAAIAPRDLGLAVNPSGQLGLPLTPEQFAEMVDVPPPDESGYLLGEPKEEPVELREAAGRVAASHQAVRAVYRALLVRSPGARPEHLVGFELDAGVDAQPIIDAAFEECRRAGIERAGFLPLQPGIDSGPVGVFMLERTRPFWTRTQ
jgi:hypothetical protein